MINRSREGGIQPHHETREGEWCGVVNSGCVVINRSREGGI